MNEPQIHIHNALGDYLIDESGEKYFDLCMGYGSVCLGHNYPSVTRALTTQLHAYSSPGFLSTTVYKEAKRRVERHVQGYQLHGFYSSGANVVEIALKMAMAFSKRTKIISFKNSMHGKTLFASALGFESALQDEDQIIKLPFIGELEEKEILDMCEGHMQKQNVAAIIVEPIQMSGGGFCASPSFYKRLSKLADQYGVVQIYDEILIGFYRTGNSFFFQSYGLNPDIVLTGKAMGSGFPVSSILYRPSFTPPSDFRAGSTFFNHPLACAAIIATLKVLEELDIKKFTSNIEECVLKHLPSTQLGGMGALWNLNLKTKENALAAVRDLYHHKIIVSYYSHYIRFLPSFLVDLEKLKEACLIVKKYI